MLKKRLLAIGIVVLFATIICGSLFYYVDRGIRAWIDYDPREYPVQTAESILQTIATQTFEPEVTPERWQMAESKCKALLQAFMIQNNNQYSVVVDRVLGDSGTPVPGTGIDEVLLHVMFQDQSRVELYFYGVNLVACKKIADSQ
jgi:hypothetical protein